MRRHAIWWLASLRPGHHKGAPLSWRRLLFLLLAYPGFILVQLIHWLGFLGDALFFPAYRKREIIAPLFILGIPRSGTTFLHRTLASDCARYTSFTTWEAVLAPSITERKCLHLLAGLDRMIGAPIRRLMTRLLLKGAADFNDIHAVDLNAPEEDYLGMLPAGGCFIWLLAFPFAADLKALGQFDRLAPVEQRAWLDFYERLLQRHLYCHPEKQMLSKNAAFSTWTQALAGRFPSAKFLICLREPIDALSSQLSSLHSARKLFATDPDGRHTTDCFTELYAHSFASLARFVEGCSPTQAAVIAQSDLRAQPAATVRVALDQLKIEQSVQLEATLNDLKPSQPSAHHHQPADYLINPEQIDNCMRPAYEAMLKSPNRGQL